MGIFFSVHIYRIARLASLSLSYNKTLLFFSFFYITWDVTIQLTPMVLSLKESSLFLRVIPVKPKRRSSLTDASRTREISRASVSITRPLENNGICGKGDVSDFHLDSEKTVGSAKSRSSSCCSKCTLGGTQSSGRTRENSLIQAWEESPWKTGGECRGGQSSNCHRPSHSGLALSTFSLSSSLRLATE